ncbi:TatD family hydrolase [Pedobacter frigidisoli]|uniref:TatD family hydrolase n=1 Tax=Pedobacter frigidisoli TaxID=2530455 RepID=UPI00292FBBD8|nr:TatD family hydrolase [Pedobacter frigidisoli]
MDFLDVHTHQSGKKNGVTSIQSLSLTSDIFLAMPKTKPISIGLHPWYAKLNQLPLQMRYMEVLAKQDNVKLIGECGLDKLKGEPLHNQISILKEQMLLAEKIQKPIILHCVKAFSELMVLKEELQMKIPLIIHGFNKNQQLGRQMQNKGFLLSFGSDILKSGSGAAELVKNSTQFLLETDSAETSIEQIYQAAANLKKCSVDELKAIIFTNWKELNLL